MAIQVKKQILKAFVFTCITLAISEILSAVLHTPRPFVMDVGQTLIQHEPTGSFPSNHMTIFSSIAFAYYFSEQRQIGKFLIAVAWLVAWARVYVSVRCFNGYVWRILLAVYRLEYLLRLTTWIHIKNSFMKYVVIYL